MQENFTIGSRLKKARQYKGLNKSQLATMAGTSGTSINNIEKDETKSPNAILLEKLASILQVNFKWLLNGEGDMLGKEGIGGNQFNGNTLSGSGNFNSQAGGSVTNTGISTGDQDCKQQLAIALTELEGARKEIELLKQMIDILKGK